MADLGIAEALTSEQIENIKQTIKTIEGLFHAVNAPGVVFPLRVSEQVLKGMGFLNQMHTQLVGQLPADEVEKLRNPNAAPKVVDPNGAA